MYIKILKIGSIVILLFLIIYLGTLIDWIFRPVVVFVQTLFVPILLAGILFYLLRPLVHLLSKKMSRVLSIILIYLGLITLGISFISFIGPEIQKQFFKLINSMPQIISDLQLLMIELQQNELVQRFGLVEVFNLRDQIEQIGVVVGGLIGELVANTFGFIGTIFNTLLLFIIVPFILFYLLKEGERLPNYFLHFFSKEKQQEVGPILTNMDKTLSSYIQGVLIVCSFIGVLYYIGFSIIGLEYALILAIIGMLTNVIPYIGPWIGAVPSVTVGLLHSPMMALFVLIIVIVIQQIESVFVQPQVIGRRMSIHPVTVMILVLVAGRFIGIVGMILVIPIYAIGKVIVTHLYGLWKVKGETK
ncbi:AI-2E family transporter [Anaerobacillus alkalidiazotrophicus]|uniref:AI-2E family transporter n=1 Tax=Anaerobacillus alkalidiazotrophicus TaxID=472963 RepID=A0A1S2M802_9BACI|nr:AI-2E family transporter [Anaerobacillus alkalidiazotrophicus]OIJ20764.1 AI-2E family transporter [Anaerobacillus alkalidiazotrophicus]